jgi:WD40 repeat protein
LYVCFSPDGKTILSGSSDCTVRLWDVATGKELRRFVGHKDSVIGVAYSHDGKRVLSASDDGTVRLWQMSPPGK